MLYMDRVGDGGGKCVCAENRYRTIKYHLNLTIPIGFILQRRKIDFLVNYYQVNNQESNAYKIYIFVNDDCCRDACVQKLTQNIKYDLNLDIPNRLALF